MITTSSGGVTIGRSDPRIAVVGGKYLPGIGFHGDLYTYSQAHTAGDPAGISGATGLPENRAGVIGGQDFVLAGGVTQFEYVTNGQGGNGSLHVEIDGVATNRVGYALPNNGSADQQRLLLRLPASEAPRRIRIWTPARPFGGLVVPTDSAISAAPSATPSSAVFLGDSISEGTGASTGTEGFAIQTAYRVGIDNPIVSAIGSSGYLARRGSAGYNFRQRINDVLQAVAGGPPDAVFIAGGINDFSVAPGGQFTPAQTGEEAARLFQALRAGAPDMLIFVVGPWTGRNDPGYSATSIAGRDALFTAASGIPRAYTIDVSTAVTPANVATVFGAGDGVHPVDAGHSIYAQVVADAARAIISRL